jgi:hypothetical protein
MLRHIRANILHPSECNITYNVLHSQLSTNGCRVVGDTQNEAKECVQRVRHVPAESAIYQVDDKVPDTPQDGNAFVKHGVVVAIHGHESKGYGASVVEVVNGVPSVG